MANLWVITLILCVVTEVNARDVRNQAASLAAIQPTKQKRATDSKQQTDMCKRITSPEHYECLKNGAILPANVGDRLTLTLCLPHEFEDLVHLRISRCIQAARLICYGLSREYPSEGAKASMDNYFWTKTTRGRSSIVTVNLKVQSNKDYGMRMLRVSSMGQTQTYLVSLYKPAKDLCLRDNQVFPASDGDVLSFKFCFPRPQTGWKKLKMYSCTKSCNNFHRRNVWERQKEYYFWTRQENETATVAIVNIKVQSKKDYRRHILSFDHMGKRQRYTIFLYKIVDDTDCEKDYRYFWSFIGDVVVFQICPAEPIDPGIINRDYFLRCPKETWCANQMFWTSVMEGIFAKITINFRVNSFAAYKRHLLRVHNETAYNDMDGFVIEILNPAHCLVKSRAIPATIGETFNFTICLKWLIDVNNTTPNDNSKGTSCPDNSTYCPKKLDLIYEPSGAYTSVTISVTITSRDEYREYPFKFEDKKTGNHVITFSLNIYKASDECLKNKAILPETTDGLLSFKLCAPRSSNLRGNRHLSVCIGSCMNLYMWNTWSTAQSQAGIGSYFITKSNLRASIVTLNLRVKCEIGYQIQSISYEDVDIEQHYHFSFFKPGNGTCLISNLIFPAHIGDVLSFTLCYSDKSIDLSNLKVFGCIPDNPLRCEHLHLRDALARNSAHDSYYYWDLTTNETATYMTLNVKVGSEKDYRMHSFRLAYLKTNESYNFSLYKPRANVECEKNLSSLTPRVGEVLAFHICLKDVVGPLDFLQINQKNCGMWYWCGNTFFWTPAKGRAKPRMLINLRVKGPEDYKRYKIQLKDVNQKVLLDYIFDIEEPVPCFATSEVISANVGDEVQFVKCLEGHFRSGSSMAVYPNPIRNNCTNKNALCPKMFSMSHAQRGGNTNVTISFTVKSINDYRDYEFRFINDQNETTSFFLTIYKAANDCLKTNGIATAKEGEFISFSICLTDRIYHTPNVTLCVDSCMGIASGTRWRSGQPQTGVTDYLLIEKTTDTALVYTLNIKAEPKNAQKVHTILLKYLRKEQIYRFFLLKPANGICLQNDQAIPANIGDVLSFTLCFSNKSTESRNFRMFEKTQGYNSYHKQLRLSDVLKSRGSRWGFYFWALETNKSATVVTLNIKVESMAAYRQHVLDLVGLKTRQTYNLALYKPWSLATDPECNKPDRSFWSPVGSLLVFQICLTEPLDSESIIQYHHMNCTRHAWCSSAFFWTVDEDETKKNITINYIVRNTAAFKRHSLLLGDVNNANDQQEHVFHIKKKERCIAKAKVIEVNIGDKVQFVTCLKWQYSSNATMIVYPDQNIKSPSSKKFSLDYTVMGIFTNATISFEVTSWDDYGKYIFQFKDKNDENHLTTFTLQIYRGSDKCLHPDEILFTNDEEYVSLALCLPYKPTIVHAIQLSFCADGCVAFDDLNSWYEGMLWIKRYFWTVKTNLTHSIVTVNLNLYPVKHRGMHVIHCDYFKSKLNYYFTFYKPSKDKCVESRNTSTLNVGGILNFDLCFPRHPINLKDLQMFVCIHKREIDCKKIDKKIAWSTLWVDMGSYRWIGMTDKNATVITLYKKIKSFEDYRLHSIHLNYLGYRQRYALSIYKTEPDADCEKNKQHFWQRVGVLFSFYICLKDVQGLNATLLYNGFPCEKNTWCTENIFWTSEIILNTNKITVNFRITSEDDYKRYHLVFRDVNNVEIEYDFYVGKPEHCIARWEIIPADLGETIEFVTCLRWHYGSDSSMTMHPDPNRCSNNTGSECLKKLTVSHKQRGENTSLTIRFHVTSIDDYRAYRFAFVDNDHEANISLNIYKAADHCLNSSAIFPLNVEGIASFAICLPYRAEKLTKIHLATCVGKCLEFPLRNAWAKGMHWLKYYFVTTKIVEKTTIITVNLKLDSKVDFKRLSRQPYIFYNYFGEKNRYPLSFYEPAKDGCMKNDSAILATVGKTISFAVCLPYQSIILSGLRMFGCARIQEHRESCRSFPRNVWEHSVLWAVNTTNNSVPIATVNARVESERHIRRYLIYFDYMGQKYNYTTSLYKPAPSRTDIDCEKKHRTFFVKLGELLVFTICLKQAIDLQSVIQYDSSNCQKDTWCSDQLFWTSDTEGKTSSILINFRIYSLTDYGNHTLQLSSDVEYTLDIKQPVSCMTGFVNVPAKIGDTFNISCPDWYFHGNGSVTVLPNPNSTSCLHKSVPCMKFSLGYTRVGNKRTFWISFQVTSEDDYRTYFLKMPDDQYRDFRATLLLNIYKASNNCVKDKMVHLVSMADIISVLFCLPYHPISKIRLTGCADQCSILHRANEWLTEPLPSDIGSYFWTAEPYHATVMVTVNLKIQKKISTTHSVRCQYGSMEYIYRFSLYRPATDKCLGNGQAIAANLGKIVSFSLCLPEMSVDLNLLRLVVCVQKNELHCSNFAQQNTWTAETDSIGYMFWKARRNGAAAIVTVNIRATTHEVFRPHKLRLTSLGYNQTFNYTLYELPEADKDCEKTHRIFQARTGDFLSFQICLKGIQNLKSEIQFGRITCTKDTWCNDQLFWTFEMKSMSSNVTINFRIKRLEDFTRHRLLMSAVNSVTKITEYLIDLEST
ncbi:hypothetical protein PoB_000916000, partial [Plakobranchus ocellatus]